MSEEQIRIEALNIAYKASKNSLAPSSLIIRAKEDEEYIRSGK